jgi:hypothetical protein
MSTVRRQTAATPQQATPEARPLHTHAVSVTGLLALQRTAGNRAVTRLLQRSNGHPPDDLVGELAAARQAARRLREMATDIVQGAGREPPTSPAAIRQALQEHAGNPHAQDSSGTS